MSGERSRASAQLFAGYYSQALGINDSGQVVGISETQYSGINTNVAVLYNNGTLLNLSNMTAPQQPNSFYGATAINNKGQIVVYGFANSAYLLTPLPVANWSVDADGNWSGPGNWNTTVPNLYCTPVLFGSATTAPRTVTVDVAATAGTLQFNSANSYTLSGTATITLDTTNVDAALSVLNGSHTIAAPLVLYSSTDVTASNPGNTLTISGVVSGGGALEKVRAGTLLLTANETYSGGTIVSAGTLVLGNGGTTGMVPGSVTNNGTLVFNLAGNQLFTGGISGAGSVMTSGPAALSVQGPLAAGQVTVNQGQFTAAAGTNIAGMLTIAPSAEFFNSVGTAYLGSLANSGVFSSAAQVSGGFSNASTGDVRIPAGQTLFLGGVVPQSNAGLIEALGTPTAPVQFESAGPFTNQLGGGNGLIAAETATFHFDSGLTNQGLFAYSFGGGNVVGQIANSGGTVSINGGAAVTFVGNFRAERRPAGQQRRQPAEHAVFLGNFSGSGGFTGGGNVFFAGGLQPGDAPAEVLFGGNAYLEASDLDRHGVGRHDGGKPV